VPALQKEFGYKNVMAVPRLEKIVVNMGLGEATANAKLIDTGADEVARITGQKPVTRRAKKSIAAFKVRKGMPIATMVTLRGERMWEFLDRLMSIALPRVRDFKGVSPRGFDGRGNYTLGLRDQLLFPEIDYMKVDKARGMNVSVVTTARTDEEARKLLQFIGMPFRQN
jgi:large subunit ribosomal protein L5